METLTLNGSRIPESPPLSLEGGEHCWAPNTAQEHITPDPYLGDRIVWSEFEKCTISPERKLSQSAEKTGGG